MDIITRELSRADRPAIEAHFLALGSADRRLRFGSPLNDAALRDYVANIDFGRDVMFGVFDDELRLVGVAHVARGGHFAELGVSVSADVRGRGIGNALFERSCMRARNLFLPVLFMHCLSENAAMMHLARKHGMRVTAQSAEADAYIDLPHANAATLSGELIAERIGVFDYSLKSQLVAARRVAAAFAPGRTPDAPAVTPD